MFVRRLALSVLVYSMLIPAGGPVLAAGSPGDCFVAGDDGWQCGHVSRMLRRLAGGRDGRGTGDPQPETPWTDVLHTKINIEVDPTGRTVYGTVTISAASRIDGLDEFIVYLEPNGGLMTVSAVGGNGAGYSHLGQKVTINLDAVYGIGEPFTVSVDYGGQPRSNDGIFWGSHNNGSEVVDIVATLSESWHARSWWVGKDVLDDKSTFEIWVTVADHLVVASNGILQSVPPDPMPDNKLRYRWEETNPMIPYLASIAVADYSIYSRTYSHLGDTMPMEFYILPEVFSAWQGYCDTYVTMTEVFSDVYGQYPFVNEKGGMAHTPTLGPYMEHQTIPSMPNFTNERINAHELAHQWWGDLITCETWGDIWLNEGITSFSEAIWKEFRPGGSAAAYFAQMDSRRPWDPDMQVYVTNVNSEAAIFNGNAVYRKGAWVTHMLRGVLGDATFFPAMLDYRQAFAGDSATTDEFITSMSATAGYDLSFFTDQWVMSPGSPDYEYGWQHVQVAGQDYLLLHVEQTQGNRGYPLMTMPLDIEVTTSFSITTYVVWSSEEVETYAIPIDGAVVDVQLDPDDWILSHSKTQVTPGHIEPNCQGDMNGDGMLNGLDVPQFVSGLLDSSTWPGSWRRSDMDFNGRCDMDDLPLFVAALLTGCQLW